MSIQTGLKAVFLAVSLVGLSACGSDAPVDKAAFDAEIQQLATDGDTYANMFLVIKDRRPELYKEFREIALQEYARSGSAKRGGLRAGIRMRPKFSKELLTLVRTTSDENAAKVISVSIDTFKHLNEEDPKDCVRSLRGEPLETVKNLPPELRNREADVIVAMFKDNDTARDRRAASYNEVTNWVSNVVKLDKDLAAGLAHSTKEKLNKGEAEELCNSTIELYKRLSYKPIDKRGVLFRGMALMVLEEMNRQDALKPEEEAES